MMAQKRGLRVLENACTYVALHTDFKPLCGLQHRQSMSALQTSSTISESVRWQR
jgi:hypothetical protein